MQAAAFLLLPGCAAAGDGVCPAPRLLGGLPLRQVGADATIPVRIGNEQADMLLDTGATMTAITPQGIHALGLHALVGYDLSADADMLLGLDILRRHRVYIACQSHTLLIAA